MKVCVIDTDVFSYIFKNDSRAEYYSDLISDFDIRCLSFQTVAEINRWALRNQWGRRRKADLQFFLGTFEILYPDEETCILWGTIVEKCASSGTPIGTADAWIAAVARQIDAPLATHNRKDFQTISDLKIL